MKHGDKAKKSAQAKASGKKAGRKGASPGKAESKSRSPKASPQAAAEKTAAPKTAAPKTSSTRQAPGGNGKSNARSSPGVISFSNAVVAAAFKRAVKKYPAAFRRLTD